MNIRGKKYSNRIGLTFAYMGSTPLFLLISGYLMYYYTAVLGLNAAMIGTIFFISRVFDGISDIIFGTVIDNTKTRLGICLPWILSMTFGSILAILLLLNVPVKSSLKYFYIFITYNLSTTVISTIYELSIVSLPSYITRDSNEISQLYIWGNIGQMITQTIVISLLLKVIEKLGGDQSAWLIVFLSMGIIGSIITALAVYLCKETVDPNKITGQTNHLSVSSFMNGLKSCINNKYWWLLLIIVVLVTAINVTMVTLTPYFSRYVLDSVTIADTINTFYSFPMMLVIPIVGLIVSKLGKRNIALFGGIIIFGSSIISFFFNKNMIGLCISAIFKSIGIGCITAVCSAMLADTIEYGQWKTGTRNQAILIGAQSAGTKVGQGLTTALLSWSIAFVGFNSRLAVQNTSVIKGISLLYSLVPMILAIIVIILLFIYDLEKRLPSILADLRLNESEKHNEN